MGLFDYISAPTSYQNVQARASIQSRDQFSFIPHALAKLKPPPHSQHPSFGHLTLLVFEAVLEVVCVSLPGYIVASQGMFDAESQKFLANLNVALFTPCLIFTKLASQLTAEKLADLAIIPIIFVVQTLISYVCAVGVSKCFGFKKRQTNFIIAMGVFGNSNSLPISLVISLSQTLRGLHWDKVPNDNDDEVGARGILYLLIFQQLGQLLRWSWGYNVLLAPAEKYPEEDGGTDTSRRLEQGPVTYFDEPNDESRRELIGSVYDEEYDSDIVDDEQTQVENSPAMLKSPATPQHTPSVQGSRSPTRNSKRNGGAGLDVIPTPANGNIMPHDNGHLNPFPDVHVLPSDEKQPGFKGFLARLMRPLNSARLQVQQFFSSKSRAAFAWLPSPVRSVLAMIYTGISRFLAGLWEFMNPPLWAMLIAIVVASIPDLQHLFFDNGTFMRNSVTRAVEQSAGVAVPLILVVLGGNLARNTLPKANIGIVTDNGEEKKLLIAALVSRMVLPTLIMAPLLALMAKYVPISIVDDKIFVIVCFLLTGAPSALQLAQICQVNNVFMGVMSKILLHSYVFWILPSTLVLVLCALESVEWAER